MSFRYTKGRGRVYGVPARDLTDAEVAALPADLRRAVKHSGVWRHVDDDATLDDPLAALADGDYARLTPAEKGARTREAKRLAAEQAGETGEEQS